MTRPLLLCLALAAPAGAAQFHIPLHPPPHFGFPGEEPRREFYFQAGAASFRTDGVDVSGPGGTLELSALGKKGAGVSVRSFGFAFSGRVDPLELGKTGGGGFSGGFEADLAWAPRGREGYVLYAGGLAGVTVLDIRAPLNYTLESGKLVVEPDTAFSLFLGVPLGAVLPFGIADDWAGALQADFTLFPAGITFFTYMGLPGSPVYGSSREIDPHFGGGVRAGLYYLPWGLFLEGAGRASSGSGNNDAASSLSLLGGIKF